ncbi:MAG: HAD family hydrolase [Gammaproteobacteria bacterium]
MPLTDYKVLTLGCYGTLVDQDSGICAALRPLLASARLSLPRAEVLEAFARHSVAELAEKPERSFAESLAESHRRLARDWGIIASEDDHALFARSIAHWPAYPDAAGALQYLRRFFKLVILSNADHASIAASRRRLDARFEAVFTPEDSGASKPDRRAFEFLIARLERLGATPRQTLHVASSVPHDLKPAAAAGLGTAWIDRRRESTVPATGAGAGKARCDYVFYSTADLVRAHQEQIRG